MWTGEADAPFFGSDPNWSDPLNWADGSPVSSLTDTDVIFGAALSATPFLNQAYSVHSLTFSADAPAWPPLATR